MKKKVIGIFLAVMLVFVLSSCMNNTINEIGTFYALREAYSKGLLTENDLTEIAACYQGMDFTDKQNDFSINLLDEGIKKQIKKTN